MKTPAWLLLSLLAASTLATRAAEEVPTAKSTSPASRYTALEYLAGGLWVAEVPPGKDGVPVKIELRFAWAENKQGLRFDSAFVRGEKRAPYTSGIYAWNAAKGKLVMFYTDSSASLTEGTVTPEDNMLVHELTVTEASGKVEPILVRLTKVGPDVFLNRIFLQKNGAWEKFIEVKYERHP